MITFTEPIVAGSGNIVITNLTDGTGTVTIAVTDSSQVAIGGALLTVNPTNFLSYGKSYAVRIASGAVRDLSGNAYAGISDVSTWNFTAPQEPSVLAQWTFADPSPATAASYGASTVADGITVSAITNGSGLTRYATYNAAWDNTISYLRHASSGVNGFVPTVSGSVSGGAFLDFAMMPQHVNDLAEAVAGNRQLQIDITANWGDEMTGALTPYRQERAAGSTLVVPLGATVSLRFYGYAANNDPYGRTLAIDDLTILGTLRGGPGTVMMFR